jgi:hypothetical protein
VTVERHVPDARFAVGDEVAMHSAVSGAVAEDQVDLVIGQPLRKWAGQRSRKGRTSLGGSCTAGHHRHLNRLTLGQQHSEAPTKTSPRRVRSGPCTSPATRTQRQQARPGQADVIR